jgi:pyridoxal phosphate enzyme (YggS family)
VSGPETSVRADARRAELAESLRSVRQRIDDACASAGRDPAEVRLVAVTKTFPATDVALLTDLGLTDFGENRDQEASRKVAELAELRPGAPARWHMVGRLQRNKVRSVAHWAAEVQSVDSLRLVDALAGAVDSTNAEGRRSGPLDVLVQASADADPRRGGCPLPQLPALADAVAESGGLALRGVMIVAPMEIDPEAAFEAASAVWRDVRGDHPEATEFSAGMSGDMEAAIRHGSTCVRVGTALLGGRKLASP